MEVKTEQKFFKKYKTFLKKKVVPSIECGDGWTKILEDMFNNLQSLPPPKGFEITKIFERMNDLQVHTKGGSNITRYTIDQARELASEVCSSCGNPTSEEKCDKCKEPPQDPDYNPFDHIVVPKVEDDDDQTP